MSPRLPLVRRLAGSLVLGAYAALLTPLAAVATPGEVFSIALSPSSAPSEIVRGPDGTVWFAEPAAGRLGRIDAQGRLTEITLPAGSAPGDLTRGRDGAIWYSDSSRPVLGRVAQDGALSDIPLPRAQDRAGAITTGADGSLWFAFEGASSLGRLVHGADIQRFELAAPFGAAVDLELGPDARIWFTDGKGGALGSVGDDGVIVSVALAASHPPAAPTDIATGADGRIWFADSGGRIGSSDLAGTVRWAESAWDDVDPSGVTLGPDARIWFVDRDRGRVGWVDSHGQVALAAPVGAQHPTAIATGADGAVWVTDAGTGQVLRLQPPLAEIAEPDNSRSLLMIVGLGLLALAVAVGAVMIGVILAKRARSRRRTHDFLAQLKSTPVSKIDPKPVRSDQINRWWRIAGRRLFLAEGRDAAVDLTRCLVLVTLATLALMPGVTRDLPDRTADYLVPVALAVLALGIGVGAERRCVRAETFEGVVVVQVRASLLARAVLLFAVGAVLSVTGGPYASLLVVAAGVLVTTVPFLHVRRSRIALTAALFATFAPLCVLAATSFRPDVPLAASALALAAAGGPLAQTLLLIPAALIGMLLQRPSRSQVRSGVTMILVGLPLAALGYGVPLGLAALRDRAGINLVDLPAPSGYTGAWLSALAGMDGAVSPLLEIGAIGAALLLFGVLRVAWRPLRWALFPAMALGALALSVAALSLIVAGLPVAGERSITPTVALVILGSVLLVASVVRFLVPLGPVEALVELPARRAAALGRIPAESSAHARTREAAVKRRVRSNWTAEGRRPVFVDGKSAQTRRAYTRAAN